MAGAVKLAASCWVTSRRSSKSKSSPSSSRAICSSHSLASSCFSSTSCWLCRSSSWSSCSFIRLSASCCCSFWRSCCSLIFNRSFFCFSFKAATCASTCAFARFSLAVDPAEDPLEAALKLLGLWTDGGLLISWCGISVGGGCACSCVDSGVLGSSVSSITISGDSWANSSGEGGSGSSFPK